MQMGDQCDSGAAAPLQLRKANVDDAALLAGMHARSRASAYRGLLKDHYLDHDVLAEGLAVWPAKLQTLAAGAGQVLIAERGGQAIGFICMFKPDEHGSVFIDNLHALPEHKGSGAGTAMLNEAERWALARGASGLHLLVLETNIAAIGFYESRGWQLTGRKDDTMGGLDVVALQYSRPLSAT